MITPFIIAATSADGYIAKDEHHAAFWTSKEDKKRFIELTKRAGVVVMGSHTFRTLPRPLHERLNIVYSRQSHFEGENVETTQIDPHGLLGQLEARGYKEVAICGGSQIYSDFLKAHAVEKIYLTIEPIIFGKGIPLFHEPAQFALTLLSSEVTQTGSVLLEYKINYHGNL